MFFNNNISKYYPRLGSSYSPNYSQSSRISNFCKHHGGCSEISNNNKIPYKVSIPNPNVSYDSEYNINLIPTINSNNSVTFIGQINNRNFNITKIDISPLNNNYTIDYTFNNITGVINITVNNYLNDISICICIHGYQKFISTTHNSVYCNNYFI
jgi:hypothetical protein